MGTRADFYLGRGQSAEWLGSIAWDGYPSAIDDQVLFAVSPESFREQVAAFLSGRDDATTPDMGWPWPWDDSGTTDYAYAFDDGNVYASPFGHGWHAVTSPEVDWPEDTEEVSDFPHMDKSRWAKAGSSRSGTMLFTA